jgi:hypothetical protein
MDEFTVDAFVNRDDPIPVISFDPVEDLSDEVEDPPAATERDRKRDRLKKHVKDNIQKARGKAAETGTGMQDRLMEKYISSAISTNYANEYLIGYSNK